MTKNTSTKKQQKPPLATIIVINRNNYDLTKQCIQSIFQNTFYTNYEILLIDNGSEDKSFEKLKAEFPNIKTIRNYKNTGFPYALNQGYRKADGHYLAPMNNDAIVLSGWLEEAIKVLDSEKNIAIAGCTEVTFEQAKNIIELEKLKNSPNAEKMTLPVGWVTKKEMIEKIGFLDTEFFSPIYGEELDWNFRAHNMGYKIMKASRSLVIHLGSQDTKKVMNDKNRFILMNFHRHRAMLFNLSFVELLRFIPGLSLIFVSSFFNGMIGYLLKSYWLTLKDLKIILAQRRKKRGFIEFKEPKFTQIK